MPEQRLLFGRGASAELGDVLAGDRTRRVFLVRGRASYRRSGAGQALAGAWSGRTLTQFEDVTPNPDLADIERGATACRDFGPDVVVAVGGGSVIDTAKAVALLAAQQMAPRAALVAAASGLAPPIPLVAVPTTAGSGSEATHFATVYVDGVKHSIVHDGILPRTAIVDPGFTDSMPARLTAVTGLDALSQALESYWSVGASAVSQALAERAVAHLWPTLVSVVGDPRPAARDRMAEGAYLAGRAIELTRTTGAHAVSYALTSRFGVPHGLAVALTLGAFFEDYARRGATRVNDPRGAAYLERTVAALSGLLGCRGAAELATAWRQLLRATSVPTSLGAVGVTDAHLDDLVREVNVERLGNHPVVCSPDDLKRVLRLALREN